jgi:tetratricopeptide (TPR) repeat protein
VCQKPGKFLLVILLTICSGTAKAKEKAWTEVQSPHFRVLTDGSVGQARRVANEFEQIRAVFASQFPEMRLETGSPLLIFAANDEYSMKSLAPAEWKKNPMAGHIAGLFQTGWEKRFAIVRLDQDRAGAYQVVYHEYVHSLLHANFHWLPTWLDEGLAEYYGSTYFEKSKVYVGAPPLRVTHLRDQVLIPIEKMMTQNPFIAFKNDDRRIDLFYAESWALVHYMVFAPGMDKGKKLVDFYNKLQRGEEQKKAFVETFGSFEDMQNALDKYVQKFAFGSYIMNPPEQLDEKNYASRALSIAETEAAIGSYRLWTHDLVDAREIIAAGLQDDPKLGELHEEMGLLDFADGKDEDAVREWSTAYQLDKQRYLSLFFKTMMSPSAQLETVADAESFHAALAEVLKINPQFAPAYVRLSIMHVRLNDLTSALATSRKAEQLEPSRAGYHLLSGKILLRQGKSELAGQFAKFVADRWIGADHNEALELWNKVPESQRQPLDTPGVEDAGPMMASGTVESTTCGDETHPMNVKLQDGSKVSSFRAHGGHRGGFSDTLWYGEDHFSGCRHLTGMRAIVYYKPSDDKQYDGDIVSLEFREDLPTPLENKPSAAPTTTSAAPQ